MTLMQSWKDSLSLFKPKNVKVFLLVTLKSIVETYKMVLSHWGVLVGLLIACFVIFAYSPKRFEASMDRYPMVAPTGHIVMVVVAALIQVVSANVFMAILYQLFLFAICLSARSSGAQKSSAYFRSYYLYFVYVAVFLLTMFFAFSSILSLLLLKKKIVIGLPLVLFPWYVFSLLFFFDSKKGIKNFIVALWRALKMTIFNLPLIALVGVLLYLPIYVFYDYVTIGFQLKKCFRLLLLPIPVCVYTNIYIKKLHDHYDLYFKQPK